jgi:carbon-monoxide dehydrogenase large subunit
MNAPAARPSGRGAGGIGDSVRRVEDLPLLTGEALFTGDLRPAGLLHARVVRSPVAHARIMAIDTSEAAAAPGVCGVFTYADLDLPPISLSPMAQSSGPDWVRPVLARDTVRFVGEMVAIVVAATEAQAADAADLVYVDYEARASVIGLEVAARSDSIPLFNSLGSNIVMTVPFEGSADYPAPEPGTRSVSLRIANPRMAVVPMEPNAVTAIPDSDTGRLTVWASTQFPHMLRDYIAGALRVDKDQVRVACKSVGGGFGGKTPIEPEYALVAAVARRLGQPVRFVQTRSENLTTMHGRDHLFDVRLEATDDGLITDLAVEMLSDAGAYPSAQCGMTMTTRSLASGPYRIPHLRFQVRCAATNTAPIVAFRGAGRPEAAAILERALDALAAEVGIDPVEIRRRNFIPPEHFPYRSPTGVEYDTGDYERCLDRALAIAGYDELRQEQQRRRQGAPLNERLLGIGIGCYVEMSGAGFMSDEYASVTVDGSGSARVLVGTAAHGQGHATVFAQVASDVLGIPIDCISVVDGDTDVIPRGKGTASSRSAQIAGSAVKLAADEVLQKGRQLAAEELEAAVEDIVVVPGAGLGVQGSPSTAVAWARLSALADERRLPHDTTPGLAASPGFDQGGGTAPFGCHIAVVEVDAEIGAVKLLRLIAVDDCGTVLNPLLADGQVHGGVFAGVAQVLFECTAYDLDGNPLTATLADYLMPSAADLPSFETDRTVTPTPKNPLGAKGLGEAGTCGALAATHNAVVDAVSHLGIRHIDLTLTPERLWEAIHRGGSAR